jgi:vitamin B12 transporter
MKNSLRARAFAPVLSVLSLAVAASLHAQTIELDPVVVSATRIEQKLSDVIPSASVITREEIERSQAATLVDLIQGQSGVEIGRNGGPGTVASIFMRGQDSKNVAVFIDGIPVQRDAIGGLKLMDIPPSQIEKVEILRGNMGAIYGESAVGGVINIYTRTGALFSGPTGSVSYGSRNTSDATAGYIIKGSEYRLGISMQRFETDGFSAMNPSQNPTRVNPDKDGLEREAIFVNGEKTVSKDLALGFKANKVRSKNEYDSDYYDSDGDWINDASPIDIQKSKQNSSELSLYGKYKYSSSWLTSFHIENSKFKNFETYNGIDNGSYKGDQVRLGFNNIYNFGKGNTTFGIESTKADFASYGEDYKREILSYYLGYSGQVGLLDYQANLRRDEVKDKSNSFTLKESANTWLVGLGYLFSENTKLTGLMSTSFRAPAVYEFGNTPSLKPEEHEGFEVGINHATSIGTFKAGHFQTKTKNAISYTATGFCISNCYKNVDQYENDGIDLSLIGETAGWVYKFNAVSQNPKNATTGDRLEKRAKEYAAADLSKRVSGIDWGAKITWSGNRTDVGHKTLESYTLVDLTASKKLSPEWTGRVKLENAFDEDYQLAYGYNTPPRGVFVTLQYQPK